jgi:SAM-dependent methyltransferase
MGGGAIDETTTPQSMGLFNENWQTYSKVVALNYMFHREVYGELRQLLLAETQRSYSFLDLACGDASATVNALVGTSIASYRGIDLSQPALAIAAKTLAVIDCRITLEHRDFVEALANLHETVDVIWIGQSLHHLDRAQKLAAMRDARRLCGQRGLLVIWEPTRLDREDQAGWLERFQSTCSPRWTQLEPQEWDAMVEHIRTSDYAETIAEWHRLGKKAGFGRIRDIYAPPLQLNRVYCYQA